MYLVADDLDGVLAGQELIGYVKLVCYMHIIGICDVCAVKIDIAKSVESLKSKKIFISRLFHRKRALKRIIVVSYIKRLYLIISVKGIVYKLVFKKNGVKRARDSANAVVAVTRHSPFSAK